MEVTIITAFFDINRKAWKGFERSAEDYFGYFLYWCSIENDLIVYVESEELKEKILKARESIKHSTEVVVINDVLKENASLYESISKTNYSTISDFRLLPNNPECNNPVYNYIVTMKCYFMLDAVARLNLKESICWIDFGFNHGGKVYKKDYFNFTLEYYDDKITLFTLFPNEVLAKISPVEQILKMQTFVQGSCVIGPVDVMKKFLQDMLISQTELNDCGLMDDDQVLFLMSYFKNEENCKLVFCEWHHSLYYLRDGIIHLPQVSFWKRIKSEIRWMFVKTKCVMRIAKNMYLSDNPK